MAQTVFLSYLSKKKYPKSAALFPTAKYMDIEGNKYSSLTDARRRITNKFLKRKYAVPIIKVSR